MRRILAVAVIGVLTTILFGVDEISGAQQDRDAAQRAANRAQVASRMARLRPGATVIIERYDGTKINAVIQDIGADSVTVLVQDPRGGGGVTAVTTQTIAVDDIRAVKEVSVAKMSRTSKTLIAAAVVAGVITLVGVCAASISG